MQIIAVDTVGTEMIESARRQRKSRYLWTTAG
jgi:hypothetical protein